MSWKLLWPSAKDDAEIAAAERAGEVLHQQVILFGLGLLADFAEETHGGLPVAAAGEFADRGSQRASVESGTRLGRRLGAGIVAEAGDRPAEPLERELTVELVGIGRGHLEITVGLALTAGARHRPAGPVKALRPRLRRAGRSAVAVEQRRGALGVAEVPQRFRAAEPHQRGVVVAHHEREAADVFARGEAVVDRRRDPHRGVRPCRARHV
jgi:hypothetical protein